MNANAGFSREWGGSLFFYNPLPLNWIQGQSQSVYEPCVAHTTLRFKHVIRWTESRLVDVVSPIVFPVHAHGNRQ